MKSQLAILAVFIGLAVAGSVFAQSASISGVYGQCDFVCRYIKINPDRTFEELLDGDLYNNQRKKGVWTLDNKTRIRARSHKPSSSLQVTESVEVNENFVVTVVDMAGAIVPGARVSGNANGRKFECVTSDHGTCEIPRTSIFHVEWNRFKGEHSVRNLAATRFQIELTYEQLDTVIDEVWLIKGNRLYIEHDGSFDKVFYLKKVSEKLARQLFPKE